MRLTDLGDHLRRDGLTVTENSGWKKRGADLPARPDTILCHHTATAAKAKGDLPTLRLLVEGRSDLPGPLCQIALSRAGVVHLIASGKANHAGKGAWMGQTSSARTIGIEAEHPGGSAGWSPEQYAAYVALCASLCRYLKVGPERVCSHAEWALPKGRKSDPNFNMSTFRAQVAAALEPANTPTEESDEMTADDWNKLTKMLDDRLRIVLRAESAEGKPTGHNNLKDISDRLDRIEKALGSGS